jgi:predicted RNase H-like HicB family nuclease
MRQIHNYRVVVERETRAGKKGPTVYNAYCPTLGLADFGATIDAAVANITKLISFHLESLAVLGRRIPEEHDATTVVTSVAIPFVVPRRFTYA